TLDHRATLRDRRFELLCLEPLPHLRSRMTAVHVTEIRIEPVAARPHRGAILDGDDLDPLATLQRVVERHHRAVDPRAAATVTEPGVHCVREIDRSSAARQVDHATLWGEYIDRL